MSVAEKIAAVVEGKSRFAVVCDRVENVEPLLPDGCAGLMPIDGPYHGVKSEGWDNEHDDEETFLAWKRERYRVWKRILASNGTLYDFASPRMGARVEVACRESFNVIANVRWNKPSGWGKGSNKETLRSFFSDSETIVVAEQKGGDVLALGGIRYGAECANVHGFLYEPLRAYLDGERIRAGFDFDMVRRAVGCAPKSGLPSHWFTRSQWMPPTRTNYLKLQVAFNVKGVDGFLTKEYEDLRKEYEDLRKEYEDLRRPFSVTAADQYTDVWNYATVPHRKGKHPCEKPVKLAQDLVRISSRPNDLVLVFFSGSGVFAAEALKQGRRVIAVDADPLWAEGTEQACVAATTQVHSDLF